MKKEFKGLSFLLLTLALVLSSSVNAFAKNFDTKPGNAHKTWTITFNKDVDINTVEGNIKVEDSNGDLVNSKIEASGVVARIKPPTGGYAPGEYTIRMLNAIKSTDGENLENEYQMKFIVPENKEEDADTLKVHYIDVGQADSILIEQNKEFMLIDAGNNSDSDLVVDYLKEHGVDELKYVIGTHPHEDHIGGLDKVIDNFNVKKVIMPKVTSTTNTYKDVIAAIQNKNLKVTPPVVGDNYNLGDAKWTVLAPNSDEYKDLNNYSIVIKLKFGNNSFIFTGDAEDISEGEMLAKQLDLQSDVLKVGHHGSNSSTTDEFLAAVNPKYAIISVGKDNDYGHPYQEKMEKFKNLDIPVYRTDECRTIVATSNGEEITFDKEPGSYNGTINNEEDEPTDITANYDIQIVSVDLNNEIVKIINNSNKDVDMTGWILVSVEGNQTYNFPDGYILRADSTVNITSGRKAKDDGINYLKWTKSYIWNNDGDSAKLYDSNNNLISEK